MRNLRFAIVIFFAVVFVVFSFTSVRDYILSDYTAPVIHADSDSLYLSVNSDESELLAGMSASDNIDGDVSGTLVVVSKTKFVAKGTLRVNYAAFDKNNNVGIAARNLTYTDYYSPRFAMSQPMRFVNGNSTNNYLKYVTAYDCLDGNITQQIKITFGDTESTGNTTSRQRVNVQVTNSAGDTSTLELWALFEDFNSYSVPAPALNNYIIYVKTGEHPDYNNYLRGIWIAGNVRSFEDSKDYTSADVRISDSAVNYNSPGVYTATYQLYKSNADGENRTAQGTASMIVVVED